MGGFFTKLWDRMVGPKERGVAIIGLDAAGKSSILYQMKLGEVIATIPTIGFNVETLQYKNITMTAWDIGGQSRVRGLWHHYYQNIHGVIFVIDSADTKRLDGDPEESVLGELQKAMQNDLLRGVPFLLLANKQDLVGALSVQQIAERLQLKQVRNRPWHIQASSVLQKQGVWEGMDWLVEQMKEQRPLLQQS